MANKFKLKSANSIGAPDAETDDILMDVFIENDTLNQILDTKLQGSVLLGRTGSGKSAVIKYVETKCKYVKRIEPEEMSLQFLSNSTILKYFRKLDVNLNLFFKVLWKHVFIVELLKLYFKDDYDKEKKNRWLDGIKESLMQKFGKVDPQKEKALDYLKTWTDKFWLDTEYRIKELEKNISDKFHIDLGLNVNSFKSSFEFEQLVNDKKITEIKYKAESIIHETHSKELIEIFKMMKSDLFTDHQRKFYIVIDDLDKEWIEDSFRYDLIGAMVEVIKELRVFKGVNIVISLRENLNELLDLGSKHNGGQREKFKPLYCNMKWEKEGLEKLINKRLKNISNDEIDISDAFYESRGKRKESGLDYVLDRTFMRPRDVISYVNHAIENASTKSQFTKDILHKAESPYSTERFHAIEDEWRENYGELLPICKFLNGSNNGFKLRSFDENSFDEVFVDENKIVFRGRLKKNVDDWRDSKIKFTIFFKQVIYLLYHVGVIGIKKGPKYPVAFFYDDTRITKDDISNNNTYYVHPSLYSYFKINTLDQLPKE